MQDDCFSGILNDDVSRDSLLGYELEYAVLQILVCDAAVIQECDVRVRGLDFLHGREGQCYERQHADATGMGAAPNASNRRVDPEITGLRHLAANESEGPFGHAEQGRLRGSAGIADEFVQAPRECCRIG